jgi:hypothetical protein
VASALLALGAAVLPAAPAHAAGPVPTGTASQYTGTYTSLTGLTPQVVRVYLGGGLSIPSSISAAGLTQYYNAGQSVVYSIKPDESPDSQSVNLSHLTSLANDIVAHGDASKTWIVLHHEPYPELTAAQFTSMYSTYAPAVRNAGVRCGVIFHTYPLYHGYSTYGTDYTNGILSSVDFIGIDTYPQDTSSGYSANILQTISPFTSLAKSNGKPFQIDEVGFDNRLTGHGTSAEASWMEGLDFMGSSVQAVIYFGINGSWNDMTSDSSVTVPAWQNVAANMASR